jgi:hypothetical protein
MRSLLRTRNVPGQRAPVGCTPAGSACAGSPAASLTRKPTWAEREKVAVCGSSTQRPGSRPSKSARKSAKRAAARAQVKRPTASSVIRYSPAGRRSAPIMV